MPLIFVYGTLKGGGCRHRYLLGSHFCGPATTAAAYRLFDLGDYPGLIASEPGRAIRGELYGVSSGCLEILDRVEGVADHWFARSPVRLQAPHADAVAEAYFALQNISGCRELAREWVARSPGGVARS